MQEKIIYDKFWMNDYLNLVKQSIDCLRLMKDDLYQAKITSSEEQAEIYRMVLQKLDIAEYNFQIMQQTLESFMDRAQIQSLKLIKFTEEQHQLMQYFM